jgi:hypothetical protein
MNKVYLHLIIVWTITYYCRLSLYNKNERILEDKVKSYQILGVVGISRKKQQTGGYVECI